MDRLLLIAATLCFLTSFGYTWYSLGRGRFGPGRVNFVTILAGFAFQSAFLYTRGRAEASCPLNSLFDVLIFQSWSLVLTYLIVGPAYRLSLLGAFTAPFALLLMLVALIAPIDQAVVRRPGINPWVETHARALHHCLRRFRPLQRCCPHVTLFKSDSSNRERLPPCSTAFRPSMIWLQRSVGSWASALSCSPSVLPPASSARCRLTL